jgi:hypothetical protein
MVISFLHLPYQKSSIVSFPGQPSNILYSYLHTNFVRFVNLTSPFVFILISPSVEYRKLPLDTLSPGRPLRC